MDGLISLKLECPLCTRHHPKQLLLACHCQIYFQRSRLSCHPCRKTRYAKSSCWSRRLLFLSSYPVVSCFLSLSRILISLHLFYLLCWERNSCSLLLQDMWVWQRECMGFDLHLQHKFKSFVGNCITLVSDCFSHTFFDKMYVISFCLFSFSFILSKSFAISGSCWYLSNSSLDLSRLSWPARISALTRSFYCVYSSLIARISAFRRSCSF